MQNTNSKLTASEPDFINNCSTADQPYLRHKRSRLLEKVTDALFRQLIIDEGLDDLPDVNVQWLLLEGTQVNHADVVTTGLHARLRVGEPGEVLSHPVYCLNPSSQFTTARGRPVWVKAAVIVTEVTAQRDPTTLMFPTSAEDCISRAGYEGVTANWGHVPSNFDEIDVTAMPWDVSELPGYLAPDGFYGRPYDWNKPLDYAEAELPPFTIVLPMNEAGGSFGTDDRFIFTYGVPETRTEGLSSDDVEARKITVKIRHQVLGWKKGWPDDGKEDPNTAWKKFDDL